jgi:hypothetical protein
MIQFFFLRIQKHILEHQHPSHYMYLQPSGHGA